MIFQIFGPIEPPEPLAQGYGTYETGLVRFLNNILKMAILGAGLFAVINFILAGYGIITAAGDPEKTSKAQQKIWNSIIGLTLIITSFTLAALLGWVLFRDTNAILQIRIYGPGT